MSVHIVIIEDQPIFSQGIKMLLEQNPAFQIVGVFHQRSLALPFLRANKTDLLMMDINLQHDVGLELLKDLHAEFPNLRILVLTHLDEMIYGERVLRAGARGYLMKHCSASDLINGINAVVAGELYLSESLTSRLIRRIYTTKTVPAADRPIEELLSDRELEVFEMIGKGKGSREIAALLKLGIKTVDNHRERIKKKLGLHDAPSLVRHASIWQHEKARTTAPIPVDPVPTMFQQFG